MPQIIKNISKRTILRSFDGITFGDVIYDPLGQCGPRVQEDYQIVRVISGELELRLDEEWRNVPPGTVVLCRPGHQELFLFSRTDQTRHQWCSIRPTLIEKKLQQALKSKSRVLTCTEAMQGILEAGLATTGNGKATTQLTHMLGMAMLHAYLAALEEEDHPDRTHPSGLQRAKRIIQSRYTEDLSLQQLADESGVSRNHLIKLFRDKIGTTPAAYLWDFRLDRSAILLKETGLSVAEVADRVGFENPFHFSRRFRKRFGCSPRDFRQKPRVRDKSN